MSGVDVLAVLDVYCQRAGNEPTADVVKIRAAVAGLMDSVDSVLSLPWSNTAARELRAAIARCCGGAPPSPETPTMTADIELLPLQELPEKESDDRGEEWIEPQIEEYATDYARACVAHATAAKDAEIEALRAEVETLRDGLDYLRQMQGAPDVLELRAKAARAERLAEALRGIRREALDGCSAMDCARDARDALSDNGFAVDGICGQSAMAATAEEAAAALEAEREDGVMQRFADMLLGVLNDTQDALGFTDEDKACPNGSIEIVAAINELREDAERYRWLRDSKACSISVSFNDHRNMYQSVQQTVECSEGYYDEMPEGELRRMIETDTIWTVHVYPRNPVGFDAFHGATLDTAIDQARGKGVAS